MEGFPYHFLVAALVEDRVVVNNNLIAMKQICFHFYCLARFERERLVASSLAQVLLVRKMFLALIDAAGVY